MNEQAFPVMIMAVCLVSIDGQQREQADQLQALAKHVWQGNVVRPVIIGIQGENAPGKRVHHIAAGRFHDDVPDKAGGKSAVSGQHGAERRKLGLGRQLGKKKEIGDLLKAKAVILGKTLHQVFHVVTPVKQTPVSRDGHAVHDLGGADVGNIGQSGENALSVQIPEPSFNIIFGKKLGINDICFSCRFRKTNDLGCNFGIRIGVVLHKIDSFLL